MRYKLGDRPVRAAFFVWGLYRLRWWRGIDWAGGPADGYFDRVLKYIPADIVGGWVAATGIVASVKDRPTTAVLWIIFIVGLVLTPLWAIRQTQMPGKVPAWIQTAVATGAFAVWVFALGGPFAMYDWYKPAWGALILIGYTLVVGLIVPAEA